MVWGWHSHTSTKSSPWLIALVLLGAFLWLSPIVSAARRMRAFQPRASLSQDIVLTLQSSGDLCVRGTSVADARRVAVIGGQTVALGEHVLLENRRYHVVAIESDQVRLRPVTDAAASRPVATMIR
jgi:hypothetical protein